ncbi:MAG: hypothetical protein ACRC2S_17470 [Waterburya sp.]
MNKILITNGVEATVAIYRDQKLREYNANPMIQALPLIMSDEEFLKSATVMPDFVPEERMLEPHLRFHCVERLSRYFDPIDKTLELQINYRRLCILKLRGLSILSLNCLKWFNGERSPKVEKKLFLSI